MSALTQDRNTPRVTGDIKRLNMAAGAIVFAGGIVMRDALGNAMRGQSALGLHGVGIAQAQVDNTGGAAGDLTIDVREGEFRLANGTNADALTIADVGHVCYAIDDQTVGKTNGGGTRSIAGIVCYVDANGVVVDFDEDDLGPYLDLNRIYVPATVTTLVGANTYMTVAPRAGRITKVWSVIEGVLTTADATLTMKINGVAITSGVITHAQAGSAAGNIASATPSGANVVAAGDLLSVTVGGGNQTATIARLLFEITLF